MLSSACGGSWGIAGGAGSPACGHVVARLGYAPSRAGTDDYRRPVLEGGRLGSMPQVLMERPRRRALQRLPPEVIDLLYRCDASTQRGCPWQPNGMVPREPMFILALMGVGDPHPLIPWPSKSAPIIPAMCVPCPLLSWGGASPWKGVVSTLNINIRGQVGVVAVNPCIQDGHSPPAPVTMGGQC